jgi:Fe-S cluster biosynthesis and repair protein YggX
LLNKSLNSIVALGVEKFKKNPFEFGHTFVSDFNVQQTGWRLFQKSDGYVTNAKGANLMGMQARLKKLHKQMAKFRSAII